MKKRLVMVMAFLAAAPAHAGSVYSFVAHGSLEAPPEEYTVELNFDGTAVDENGKILFPADYSVAADGSTLTKKDGGQLRLKAKGSEGNRRAILQTLLKDPDGLKARQAAHLRLIVKLGSQYDPMMTQAWVTMLDLEKEFEKANESLSRVIHEQADGGFISPDDEEAFQACADHSLAVRKVALFGYLWPSMASELMANRMPRNFKFEPELTQKEALSLQDVKCLKAMRAKGIEAH